MLTQATNHKNSIFSIFLLSFMTLLLSACGDSAGPDSFTPHNPGKPKITISMSDEVAGNTASVVTATLKSATGAPVADTLVTFSTDTSLVKMDPESAIVRTNGAGIATIKLTALRQGGNKIKAQATVASMSASAERTYSVGTPAQTFIPKVKITLLDSSNSPVTTISNGASAIASARVTDKNNNPVAGVVITFKSNKELVTISPSSATALTNSQGIATVNLTAATLTAAGAATITAEGQFNQAIENSELTTPIDVSDSLGFAVGAANMTISTPSFGLASISAYGTTSVSVTISSNGQPVNTPQTVSFNSPCATEGKAVLTSSVITDNQGVASATYRDKGCGRKDNITASVGGVSSYAQLSVAAPSIGSIQFIAAIPSHIALRSMGGANRQESAEVTFKVADTNGQPIGGKEVEFALSTDVGGITVTPTKAISDPSTGHVVAIINSGTVSTPIRVLAKTNAGTTAAPLWLTTQSDKLTISTGIPSQNNISLSASTFNIEGLKYDGISSLITARLADHFNNPVQDGTVVNFIAEGGAIQSSCETIDGACEVTFRSQSLRPSNGRVSILAYALGEEGFKDKNSNGYADVYTDSTNPAHEMFDENNISTDMPEAFLDANESKTWDNQEFFVDFNRDGQLSPADGDYNGVLCDNNATGSTACSKKSKSIHVRDDMLIILSGSKAKIVSVPATELDLPPSCGTADYRTVDLTIVDENNNSMPAGSTIKFATSNGVIITPKEIVVPNVHDCRSSSQCPASATDDTNLGKFKVSLQTDRTPPACQNPYTSGILTITVTTPKGDETTHSIRVND